MSSDFLRDHRTRLARVNWMLLVLLGVSVAIHALILWHFLGEFHSFGTGAAEIVLAPAVTGESASVPQPPAPLAPAAPKVRKDPVPPETGPQVHRNHEYPEPAPGAFPSKVPVMKWKGGPAGPAAARSEPAAHASAASVATGVSGTSGRASDLESMYRASVRRKIVKMRHYPVSARLRRLTGVVKVRFVIQADGRAEDVKIVSGSGSDILDSAALDAVNTASPFQPLPKALGENTLVLDVPIKFELVTP